MATASRSSRLSLNGNNPQPHEISYQQFLAEMKKAWEPGKHVAVIGPSGCGKTWLVSDLLQARRYVVVVATKSEDSTLDKRYRGFTVVHKWNQIHYTDEKILFWPPSKTLTEAQQRASLIHNAFEHIYVEKHRTLVLDDVKKLCYLAFQLKKDIATMMTDLRSQGSSIVSNLQRPFGAGPLECVDQASFWIVFHIKDEKNCDRIAEIVGDSPKTLNALNRQLGRFDFLFMQEMAEPVIVRRNDARSR